MFWVICLIGHFLSHSLSHVSWHPWFASFTLCGFSIITIFTGNLLSRKSPLLMGPSLDFTRLFSSCALRYWCGLCEIYSPYRALNENIRIYEVPSKNGFGSSAIADRTFLPRNGVTCRPWSLKFCYRQNLPEWCSVISSSVWHDSLNAKTLCWKGESTKLVLGAVVKDSYILPHGEPVSDLVLCFRSNSETEWQGENPHGSFASYPVGARRYCGC